MATDCAAPALQPDWTQGVEALLYEACEGCGHREYLRRGFCPHCGSQQVRTLPCSGKGKVYAATVVVRAPSPEWKALAPYVLLLVDLDEGVRAMVHGTPGLAIGARVAVGWSRDSGRPIPFAYPESL